MEGRTLYSYIIFEDLAEFSQWRITISEFRGKEYFGIRKYFLSYEGTWEPTKEGISTEYTLTFTHNLLLALSNLVSRSELDMADPEVVSIIDNSKKAYCSTIIDNLKSLANETK
jgi:hypothetical protein